MENITKDWTTTEIIEFLNSYNRVFKHNTNESSKYVTIYVHAFEELMKRNPIMALLY